MGKYDSQLGDLRNQLASSKNVLVVLPAQLTTDKLAAGLALLLSLNNSGKEVSIVTQDTPKVSDTNLYGVGQVSSTLPKVGGGNLTITLEGVVGSDGTVPALEKLDWYPQGANLNLVFHVLPGQRFEPARILPSYQGSGVDLIFTIGAQTLDSLGNIYQNNREVFSAKVVNVDNSNANTQYGQFNVVDPAAGTISEMIAQILPSLNLPLDADTSSNILTGIYDATSNLTVNVKPETFMAVGTAMQSGGKVPGGLSVTQVPQMLTPQAPALPQTPADQYNQAGFPPLNQVFGFPIQSGPTENEPAAQPEPQPAEPQSTQSSAEERPMGEMVGSSNPEMPSNPEPDWLTPKIYKGVH
jgi:hypothetical protein